MTIRQDDRDALLGFERAVAEIPSVVQAQRSFGDPDYLLRILTTDLTAYQRLEDDVLATLPGVQRLASTLVMKRVAQDRPYPDIAARGRILNGLRPGRTIPGKRARDPPSLQDGWPAGRWAAGLWLG